MGRPGQNAENLGDPIERQLEVVVQDHHRAMVDGQPAEAALELVAIDDRAQVAVRCRLVDRQQPQVRSPASMLPTLGVAGAHEEPVRPGLEGAGSTRPRRGRVAELREVLPDGQQRLLRGVLGQIEVEQDPARHGKESTGDLGGNQGVGPGVTALGSDHESGIHALSACRRRSVAAPITRYG
jgi:hypothetical protein